MSRPINSRCLHSALLPKGVFTTTAQQNRG
jgi:hypothetical protein